MDAQRSLAAIVFTDVVGYSALMARDEARAMDLFAQDLAVMRKICGRNDGQILKTMGDGVLMVFGSAVQAVASALEMQAAFTPTEPEAEKRLVHRIGIHVGDVLLSESDAQGDGVNVAARLHEAAPPGGIWVSSTVYDIVKGRLPVTGVSRGNREFKNIPVPVMVFEISQGGEPAKVRTKRTSPKPVAAMATAFLAVAVVIAGGLIYAASLHTPAMVTKIIQPAPLVAAGTSSHQAPSPTGGAARSPRVDSAPPRSYSLPPQPRRTETGTLHPSPTQQVAKTTVPTAKPQPPQTPPKSPAAIVKAPPPSSPPLPSPTENASIGAGETGGAVGAKAIDPAKERAHYFFKRYIQYLRGLPDAGTPAGKQAMGRWHGMALLKDQAIAYLTSHAKDAPLTVHMDGPFGTADYKVAVTGATAKNGQPKVELRAPDGTSVSIPFGTLTSNQVDAIFQAVGQALYQDPGSAAEKAVFQRRLNVFETEYGLPKSSL